MTTAPRFAFIVEVCKWPLPEGVDVRFHYFRREKDARRMVEQLDTECRFERLAGGPTFQKPVSYATLEHHGLFFEVRHDFPYETTEDDVNEAWLDKAMLGCDCNRSDLIVRTADEPFERLQCGNTIRAHGRVVLWESNPLEYQLH